MTSREYLEDQDTEEPDDFIISLTSQVSIYVCFFSEVDRAWWFYLMPAAG